MVTGEVPRVARGWGARAQMFGGSGVLALGSPEELERGAGTTRLSDSGVSGKEIACKNAGENFAEPFREKQ